MNDPNWPIVAFRNPYLDEQDERLTTFVSTTDHRLIRSIRPVNATITTVIGILFKKLCHELRNRAITDVTSESEFESFLIRCKLVDEAEYNELFADASQWRQHQAASGRLLSDDKRRLSDRAVGGVVSEAGSPHVGGGDESTCVGDTTTSPKLSDIQKRGGTGRKGKVNKNEDGKNADKG